MRPTQLLVAIASLSAVSSAWFSFDDLSGNKAIQGVEGLLNRRQDSSTSTTAKTSTTQKTTTTAKSTTGSQTSNKATSGASASGSGTTATGTADDSASTGSSNSSLTTSYDARLPAGGIAMVTPGVLSGNQYYKIGDHVTFAWNLTSVLRSPSAVDILASCSANAATYTLALNQSVKETGIVWDTGKYQKTATIPLLTNMYTLLIYDSESSVSAVAQPGLLAPYNQFSFGMYTPQPYTPVADFQCATCSAGFSQYERQTLGFMLGMMTLTVLSFGWFARGFGAI